MCIIFLPFWTYCKDISLNNVLDEAVQIIALIQILTPEYIFFNILCEEMELSHKALLLPEYDGCC